jgi:hypothetical protein
MPVECTAVTNCPSKRMSRASIARYRSSKLMALSSGKVMAQL